MYRKVYSSFIRKNPNLETSPVITSVSRIIPIPNTGDWLRSRRKEQTPDKELETLLHCVKECGHTGVHSDVIPLLGNSRRDKSNLRCQKDVSGCLGSGRRPEVGDAEVRGCDGCYAETYICQNLPNCTLKTGSFHCV